MLGGVTTRAEPNAGLKGADRDAASRRRAEIAAKHLRPKAERPAPAARGVHHVALISSDVERTVDFYQGLLEFPLTDMFENRDYGGSTPLFFDIANGNTPALFPPPGLAPPPLTQGRGGPHPPALPVDPDHLHRLQAK